MGLSVAVSPGPSLPSGLISVKVKNVGNDPASSANQKDVTVLGDTARQYQDAPLKDRAGLTTVTATFYGSAPSVTPMGTTTGWICTESETEAAVGEFQKGSATWVYVP